jgi:hypothetical protein
VLPREVVMLEELVHAMEARLRDLGRSLWPSDPLAGVETEAQRLGTALADCLQALRRACTQRAAAQRRLRGNRQLIDQLPNLIRRCIRNGRGEEAYQHALALDRARQEIAEDQVAVPRLGQLCWSLQFQSRQLQRCLSRLQQKLSARDA